MLHLNIFSSIPPSTNPSELKSQIISTRVFIVSFVLSTGVLLFYTSIIPVTKSVTIKTPDLKVYLDLQNQYPETVICPCKHIAIQYDRFLQVNYTLHQVCSSVFITDYWLSYINNIQVNQTIWHSDFQVFGVFIFQALRFLCESVNRTIVNNLIRFYGFRLVNYALTPKAILNSQIQPIIDEFKSYTTNEFLLSLRIIRDITQMNRLYSSLRTHSILIFIDKPGFVPVVARQYGNCTCTVSVRCKESLRVLNEWTPGIRFEIPGMYEGCYVLEALLQSSLKCFYDKECFDNLKANLNSKPSAKFKILTPTASSPFNANSTIEDLLDKLMVERWDSSFIYENYFNECLPLECRYSYQGRNYVIYIVTTLIGLIGGLVTGLRLVVPILVKIIGRKKPESSTDIAEHSM